MYSVFLLLSVQPIFALIKIKSCPAPSPCRCGRKNDSFQYIYCSKQSWTNVPKFKQALKSNAIYDELVLSSNSIKKLGIDSFTGIAFGIRSIDLTNNPIEKLHKRTFAPIARYLRDIRLSANPQTNPILDCQALRPLKHLKSLQLISFTISTDCVFPNQLENLILDKCVFKSTEQTLSIGNVQSLKIEFSDLRNVRLPEFHNLEHLSLRGNGLKTTTISRLNAPRLKSLDLSTNRFSDLLPLIEHIHSLQTLIVKDNELTASSVRSLFEKHCCLRNLTKLNLDRNFIDGSMDELSLPSHLKDLSVRQNEITSIGYDILFLPPLLHTLDMAGNPLTQTTNGQSDDSPVILSYLKHLDLSGITTLPEMELVKLLEHTATHLTTLILSNMNLQRLPSKLSDLIGLKSLDVSDNQIGVISNLPENLQILFANNASLTDIHQLPKGIQVLSMNRNPLGPFTPPKSLQTLFIDHYSHCDCSSIELYKWLKNNSKSSVICENPENWEFSEVILNEDCYEKDKFEIDLKQTPPFNRFQVDWTSSLNVSRVTLRQLPLGPLISSPTLLNHSSSYEFADNSSSQLVPATDSVLTYQVCLIVRRKAPSRLIRLDKYCKNFDLRPKRQIVESKQFRQPNRLLVFIAVVYTSLGVLVIVAISLLIWLYIGTTRRRKVTRTHFQTILDSISNICTDCKMRERGGFDVPDDGYGKYIGEITTSSTCFYPHECHHLYHEIDCAHNKQHTIDSLTSNNSQLYQFHHSMRR